MSGVKVAPLPMRVPLEEGEWVLPGNYFAGAIMAALPTLLVYIVAGRYFVRGLMAGSVKG